MVVLKVVRHPSSEIWWLATSCYILQQFATIFIFGVFELPEFIFG